MARLWRAIPAAVLVLLTCPILAEPAAAADFFVPAEANIYGAGHASPPGGGILPIVWELPLRPGGAVTIPTDSGRLSLGGDTRFAADGLSRFPEAASGNGGLGGFVDLSRGLPLVGVFLDSTEPQAGTEPPRLDFTRYHHFHALAPALREVFFVGDGRTGLNGEGELQLFLIPDGATRLILGYVDTCSPPLRSPPGCYGDNRGGLVVVPALAT